MTTTSGFPEAVLEQAPALLERAIGYTRGSLALVTSDQLAAPTPCSAWNLGALLAHMDDALAALTEVAELGRVAAPGGACPADAPVPVVAALRARACGLLGAWSTPGRPATTQVADRRAPSPLLALAGALEVTVHGWDVARACAADRPLPDPLALELLPVARLLVGTADRPDRFAPPVPVPAGAAPGMRLLGFLGRRAATAGNLLE
jgi:uncharacterized protein (TIGR03086 family)